MTQQIRLTLPQWAIDNVILLNVRLNDILLIRMMLDTGAKYTILTPEIAEGLGLDLQEAPHIPITTATRLEMAPLTTIARVDVHGLVFQDVPTAIMDLPPSLGVDGLLGMSFLKRCRVILDIPKRLLEFEAG